jgi:hypothetical protein
MDWIVRESLSIRKDRKCNKCRLGRHHKDQGNLYIGDFGNNDNARKDVL